MVAPSDQMPLGSLFPAALRVLNSLPVMRIPGQASVDLPMGASA